MPLYREDMEEGPACRACGDGCPHGELYLHSACHPQAPTWVSYFADLLTLHCSACRKVVASFVVASRADESLDGPHDSRGAP
jgi:hypothetical protein